MKKTLGIILCALLSAGMLFAQEAKTGDVETSSWISVDFAYYFQSAPLAEPGTNWAKLTGPYSGLEGRITPWYETKIALPGSNALTSGNNVKLKEGLEFTPVSLMVKAEVVYTPIAFLNFSGGLNVGTGWGIGDVFKAESSMGYVSGSDYKALKPFVNYYIEPWAQALFQFDVAAVLPAEKQDWMHIVLQATYKINYTCLTGVANDTPWSWQLVGDRFNGLKYDSVITLGYMFPEQCGILSLAGVQVEMDGYYADVYKTNPGYVSNFMGIGISPTLVLNFNPHNSLAIQCRVKDRRSFVGATDYTGTVNGVEWYFDRIALSYTYSF